MFGRALMEGARADAYAANATNCFRRATYFYFREVPLLLLRY